MILGLEKTETPSVCSKALMARLKASTESDPVKTRVRSCVTVELKPREAESEMMLSVAPERQPQSG